MQHRLTHPLPSLRRATGAASTLATLWRDIVSSWRHAVARSREQPIDDATLRDLGITRSELSSFEAEAAGLAPRTRLRLLHPTTEWGQ